jgi:hypothetical protein
MCNNLLFNDIYCLDWYSDRYEIIALFPDLFSISYFFYFSRSRSKVLTTSPTRISEGTEVKSKTRGWEQGERAFTWEYGPHVL